MGLAGILAVGSAGQVEPALEGGEDGGTRRVQRRLLVVADVAEVDAVRLDQVRGAVSSLDTVSE